MKKINSFNWVFTLLLILTVAAFFGCDKKTEENGDKDKTKTEIKTPDLSGKWTGLFDGKSAVLDITEQTDSSFSGKINISYRQAINQEVKGTFSPTSLKMTMTDQLHSRFQGVYNGSLSKEANNFSGTFTLNNDGSKYSFNLNKK
jgi:hypothetical protein